MLVALSVLRFNLLISTLIPKKPRIKLQNSIFCSKKVQLGHCPHYRSFRWEDKSLVETGKESKHTHNQQGFLNLLWEPFTNFLAIVDDLASCLTMFEVNSYLRQQKLWPLCWGCCCHQGRLLSFISFESEDKMRMNIYVVTKSSSRLLFWLILAVQSITTFYYVTTMSLPQSLRRQFSQLLSKCSSFARIWQSLTSGTSFWWKSQQSLQKPFLATKYFT